MEIRKMQMKPEDETRLRELLKIHEADIDALSDTELDAAEKKTEQRLRILLKNQSQPISQAPLLRFRKPLRTGTMALLAAAAVMLFVQMQKSETGSQFGNMVTKGNSEIFELFCEIAVVGEAVTGDPQQTHFEVAADKSSYLKMHCSEAVYVHVGFMEEGRLRLAPGFRNLEISKDSHVIKPDGQPVNLTDLAVQKSGLKVLVTKEPLAQLDLTETERRGLWLEEIPLSVKR